MKRLISLFVLLALVACGGRTFEQRTAKYAEVRGLHDGRAAVLDAADTTGRWGYVDSDGKLVIECRYVYAADFSEGLAAVRLAGGDFGFIDRNGKWAVKPLYREVTDFEEGMAWVMNPEGRFGRIDKKGRETIPCIYDARPETLRNGWLRVCSDGYWGYLLPSGEELVPCRYEELEEPDATGWIRARRDGKWGVLLSSGKELFPCKYDLIGEADGNGLIPVVNERKHGFLGADGKELLPCSFSYISGFEDGYARINYGGVVLMGDLPRGGLWGLIDTLAREVIPCRYAWLDTPAEGLAAFRLDEYGNYGYVDTKGNVSISPRFSVARPFADGVAVVSYNNVDFGLVDRAGEEMSSFRYKIIGQFNEGMAPFNINLYGMNFAGMQPRCGYIDVQGREMIPVRYDDARPFSERRAAVLRFGTNPEDFYDARWGYIAPTGELVVPYKYHEAYPFNCGLARVFIKGQGYGFIDRQGKEVVPCKYQQAEDYHDFHTRVKYYDQTYTLDEKGQVVAEN